MKAENVEAIYPLTPLQEGILFHVVSEPEEGHYFFQMGGRLRGALDVEAFRSAWKSVIDRHTVLRTSFHWKELGKNLQVVNKEVELPWRQEDWSDLDPGEQKRRFARFREEDRRRGFDLSQAPLLRFHLVRRGPEEWFFLWSCHHIVIDGWCSTLILREVFAFYAAALEGGEPGLAPSPPFKRYVNWLRQRDLSESERYWRHRLADFSTPTPLGIDRPPRGEDAGHSEVAIRLSLDSSARLAALARRHRLTVNTLLQAAWGLLLGRYSDAADVVFGSTVSGRSVPVPGIQEMVGLMINTLPMRLEARSEKSLLAWLKDIQDQHSQLLEHEHTPLLEVQRWSGVPQGRPLFESILVFENFPNQVKSEEGGGPPLSFELDPFIYQINYPLVFLVMAGERLAIHANYETRRFEATAMQRLLGHMGRLLDGLDEHLAQPVSTLSILSAAERHQLLEEWNDTRRARPLTAERLHDFFEHRARAAPTAVATVHAGVSRSYEEINRLANQMARQLSSLGVGPGDLVAVFLERRWEMVPTLLAILKSGAAYVPLEPVFPPGRVRFVLESLGIEVMVTESGLVETLAPALEDLEISHLLLFDSAGASATLPAAVAEASGPEDWRAWPDHDPEPRASADDLAYVIFTSGSTGTPKGVVVRHRPVVSLIEWVNGTFGVGPEDRVLFITSLCFDLSVYDVFGLLAAGGSIHVASAADVRDPEALVRLLLEEPITFWDSAPAALQQLVPFLPESPSEQARLRRVFLSGDWIPLTLPDQVRAVFPKADVISLGGATEATVWSNFHRVDEISPLWKSIPYGRPITTARYHVLDATLRLCPIGVEGDLFIGGGCLASGYTDSRKRAERFIPDPFGAIPGAMLYRTGDRARHYPDGSLEFLGRLDHQVKIRGFRIELGEIESVLSEHEAVAEAVVVARQDETGHRQLVAYLRWSAAGPVAEEDLRAFLAEGLPPYMLPAAFVTLEAFPVTANGKLDREALPAPGQERRLEHQRVAPRNATEQQLASLWTTTLRLDAVGVHDNFFELGGDSILSLQMVSKARQEGLALQPRQIFENPTIAELAAVLSAEATLEASEPLESRDAGPATGSSPLGPAQLWLLEQDLESPHHFNQAFLFELLRTFDAGLLARAFAHLEYRHDALRWRLSTDGERLEHDDPAVFCRAFAAVDLRGASLEPSALKALLERESARAQASLDLARGPLWRALLFQLPEGRDRLLFACHHFLVDGVSWRILLEDLLRVYDALASGRAVDLGPRGASFKSWAEHLHELAQAPETARQREYWLAPARAEILPLPVDLETAENTVASARSHRITVDRETTGALLREVPTAFGQQIEEALLSAVALAFGRVFGRRRLLVELEGHGRGELTEGLDISRTVGWLTVLYPVLLELDESEISGTDPGAALARIGSLLAAVPSLGPGNGVRGLGYGLLRYVRRAEENERASWRALPEPEVVFNYLGQLDRVLDPSAPVRAAAESAGPLRHSGQRRRHLFEINAHIGDGELRVDWAFSVHRHREESVVALAAAFQKALGELVVAAREEGGRRSLAARDFPLARVDQLRLESLARRLGPGRIGDLYGLSHLQEGMLFHTLLSPETGTYGIQLRCDLEGELDTDLFRQAWRRLFERHGILRTAFAWEGLERPLQAVMEGPELPFVVVDLRPLSRDSLSGEAARTAGEELSERLFTRPYDLERAPLVRLLLVRISERRWRFVLGMHHLLADGWSLAILIREAFALYLGAVAGQPVELPEPRPFRDYIAWLEARDPEASAEFWRETLHGAPPGELLGALAPESRGRAAVPSERQRLSLPAGLDKLARGAGLTLGSIVQGAWGALTGRLTGRGDVVFGVTMAGRPADLAGVGDMVGLFINTLPLRLEIDEAQTVSGFLKEAQKRQAAVAEHAFSPLVRIAEWASLDAGELFDNILVFENYPVPETVEGPAPNAGAPLALAGIESEERSSYPLSLVVSGGADLRADLIFDPELIEPTAVQRLLRQLEVWLEAVVADPDQRLGEVPLLAEAERFHLLREWSGRPNLAPPAATLRGWLAATAARSPEADAVIQGEETISYGELARRAGRLARYLAQRGVGPDTPVGLRLPRSPEMIVGLWAVLEAGGVYVPLDPAYPRGRLERIIVDTRMPLVLDQAPLSAATQPRQADGLDATEFESFAEAEKAAARLAEEEDLEVVPRLDADHLAYVIHTSGSTGRPKGVMVTHGNAVRSTLARFAFYPQAPERFLLVPSFSFDSSIAPLFWTLTNGGALVLPTAEEAHDADRLARLLERHRVTHWLSVPSLWEHVLERVDPATLDALEAVVVAGEACPPRLVAEHARRLPEATLYNEYGPTEATVWCSVHRFEPRLEGAARSGPVPIGRPIPGSRLVVVDPRGRLLPRGISGELWVGGEGVVRGYLERPGETAERFVPDAFSGAAGERLYRTGDRVRLGTAGDLEFLGRVDQQVKIRGYRIELAEIEAALVELPGIERAVATAVEGPSGRRLVAHVVAGPGEDAGEAPATSAAWREALAERLPEYMIPDRFVALAELPLLPNGKVDRDALPPVADAASVEGSDPAALPRDATEAAVLGVFQDLLGREIGIHDDFFAFGGHSLLAMRAISRLRDACAADVSLPDLFERPTAAELALRVAELRAATALVAPPVPVPRDRDFPLSFAQQRLWFLDRLGGGAAYNVPLALRLRGDLDANALEAVLERLVRRHEALRTVFPTTARGPAQRPLEPSPTSLSRIDLRALPEPLRSRELRRAMASTATVEIDLERGPLLVARVVELAEEEAVLLLTVHHVASDAWSMALLIGEMGELYAAWREARPPALPRLPIQYADYALWQREGAGRATYEADLAYWRERLGGELPVLDWPGERTTAPDRAAGVVDRRLDSSLAEALVELGRRRGATLFMTVLSALSSVLGRLAGQEEVVIGAPIAGREHPLTQGLVGCFLNTLALRCDLGGEPSFDVLLERTRTTVLEAYAHQGVPFEKVVEEVQPRRDLERSPLFEVLLNVMDGVSGAALGGSATGVSAPGRLELPGFEAEALAPPVVEAKFLLTVEVLSRADGSLDLVLVHQRSRLSSERAEHLLEQLVFFLEQVVEQPAAPLGALSLVTPRAAALLPDPAVALDEPFHAAPVDVFLERAQEQPERPALCFEDEAGALARLSYGELAERVTALARALRQEGSAGEVIAVEGPRGPELVTAMLGVMKSGAVLLALDPRLPAARRREMLERANARRLLRLDGNTSDQPAELDVEIVDFKALLARGVAAAGSANLEPLAPGSPAYVFFTSGTSGRPKGILGRHASLGHFLDWQRKAFAIGPRDRVPFLTSLAFDPVLRDLFLPLTSGGELHLPGRDLAPAEVLPWLSGRRVTVLHAVPSVLEAWLAAAPGARLSDLRWCFLAGEPLKEKLVRRLRPILGSSEGEATGILNFYGSTETTLIKTFGRVPDPPWPGVQPIDEALPQTQVLVMSDAARPCGLGEKGEIFVRTPFRSLGYLDAEETARRFVPNPHRDDPEDLLYRTGDAGRYRLDGRLDVLGRLDDQVKIRGVRVEPAEVAAVLADHPDLAACHVEGRRDESGDASLTAYLVSRREPPETDELRRFAAARLPAAMVPTAWVVLERFPLTPNGKLDRRALPLPADPVLDDRPRIEPRDDLEKRLVEIWEEVLERSPIGVTDNFFDLGGHSLLGVELLARVRGEIGHELPLASLFEAGEIATQAALLREAVSVGETSRAFSPLVNLRSSGERPPIFCVHPGRGGILCYDPLARELGPSQPFSAFQARGLGAFETPLDRVEDLADLYLTALLEARPEGPYLLGGWSFGGLVAFEMAHRLRAQGFEVALLAVLDTILPSTEPEEGPSQVEQLRASDRETLDRLVEEALRNGELPADFRTEDASRLLELMAAHQRAGRAYQPRPYPGKITFFHAAEPLAGHPGDSLDGWRELAADELEVVTVPGDHFTMMREPRVRELARQLRRVLAEAGRSAVAKQGA